MQSHAVRCTPAHHSRLNEAHLCSLGGHTLGRLERWPRTELVLRFAIGDDEMLHLMREALSGTQRHSAAKTGTHMLSQALTGTHRHSQALTGTRRHSKVLTAHLRSARCLPSQREPVAASAELVQFGRCVQRRLWRLWRRRWRCWRC